MGLEELEKIKSYSTEIEKTSWKYRIREKDSIHCE